LSFSSSCAPRRLPSFPTRRSSDLFRKYFGRFAEKYHFQGAFDGMFRQWDDRAAFWGYLATFLHTTQTAPVRDPYLDLDALLKGRSEEHTSELQSRFDLVCRLLLEK